MEIFGSQFKKNTWKVLYSDRVDHTLLMQAKQWGYNALVVAEGAILAKEDDFKVIRKIRFGDEVFPFDRNYREKIQNYIQSLEPSDAILWESPYFDLDCREHLLKHSKLKIELLLEELSTLETFTPLFYVIPSQLPTKHFVQMEKATGPKTFLVFSSESAHWRVRREKSLPIVEGLCEEIPLILSETGRLLHHLKPGAFIKIEGSLGNYATCHLEAAVQALDGINTFEEAGWRWLKKHRPEVGEKPHLLRALAGFAEKAKVFKAIQAGALIPFEELKMQSESLTAEMKLFFYHLHQSSLDGGKFYSEVTSYLEELKKLSHTALLRS